MPQLQRAGHLPRWDRCGDDSNSMIEGFPFSPEAEALKDVRGWVPLHFCRTRTFQPYLGFTLLLDLIGDRIFSPRLAKTFQANEATIALATGHPGFVGIVTTMGHFKRYS